MNTVHSKVLVFGEYSVLYNSMALTIPFRKFSGELCYPDKGEENAISVLSNKGIREFCNYILEHHTNDSFQLNVQKMSDELDKGLFFKSNIPQGFGLGSSGALVAAIFLRYLDKAIDFKEEVKGKAKNKLGNLKQILGNLESHFHGKSSGIDPLSILIDKPLLLKSNKDVVEVDIPAFNSNGDHVVFLLNTKLSRCSENLIERFTTCCEDADFRKKMSVQLINFTNNGIKNFLDKDTENLYDNLRKLVNFQINEMDFLIPEKFQNMVQKGLDTNDYFLKICGSGGGGYMIGFTNRWGSTKHTLRNEDLEILYRY